MFIGQATFYVLSALITATTSVLSAQVPLTSSFTQGSILNPAVRQKISNLVKDNGIIGYSMGIYYGGAENEEEYAQWGKRTEEGDAVAAEVCTIQACLLLLSSPVNK
jgi:hypothetical protein